MNPLDAASEQGEVRRQRIRRREIAAAVLLLTALFGATRLHANWQRQDALHASDAATILALAGVRAFAEHADPRALMEIPLGADSMVVKARVFAGEESAGSYAVLAAKVGASAFRLRSTGRLVARGKSMMCSVEVFVQLNASGESRPSMGVEQDPLCNGSRHSSAVTRIRNIGS